MSQAPKLREQIDACRAGRDDLLLPELAELARAVEQDRRVADELVRCQRLDAAVAAALHDVPVPEGLLDRLLAATGKTTSGIEPEVAPQPAVQPAAAPHSGRLSRRQWTLVGSSLALVTVLAVCALQFWQRPARLVSQAELSSSVNGWMSQINAPKSGWSAIGAKNQPAIFSSGLPTSAPLQGWQQIRAATGSGLADPVIAVNLAPAAHPRAVLFVVRASARFQVPPAPTPSSRLGLSGGLTGIAWQPQGSDVLFVLVVEERGQRLEDFLQSRHAA